MAIKLLRLNEDVYFELKLIAAEINSKGIRPFIEDIFTHIVANDFETSDVRLIDSSKTGKEKSVGVDINAMQAQQLNIRAAKNKTSLANYMESICSWLANEHRENGRVWIDDTPVKALPIRMRK